MSLGEETKGGQSGGIVCAGNFIVDRVHTLSYWPEQGNLTHITHQDIGVGGGAANVVTDLSSLGFPGRLSAAGCLGDDADGVFVRERLSDHGIDVSRMVSLDRAATAHTHVMSVPGQSRTFFYHGGANDDMTQASIDIASCVSQGYRLFYLGYLMLLPGLDKLDHEGRSGASRLLETAQKAGLLTCVDFVSSEDPAFQRQVEAALPYCDYVIINEIEAGRATGITVRDSDGVLLPDAVLKAGDSLLSGGVKRGAIIHAPELSLWLERGREPITTYSLAVAVEDIVSPVGAGDAFCAAVLYGLHEGWPSARTAAVAHRAAAHCLGGATATDGIPHMSVLVEETKETEQAFG